ncbi:MAG: hypothetical protein H7226_03345 [Salinibacterium sp.]|nr:hypothetical protein [Salinibacterium sp.]
MSKTQVPYIKSRGFAIFMVVSASLMLLLALVNLIINTGRPGTYLALFLVMPWSLWVGIQSLRAQKKQRFLTPPAK